MKVKSHLICFKWLFCGAARLPLLAAAEAFEKASRAKQRFVLRAALQKRNNYKYYLLQLLKMQIAKRLLLLS